VSSDEAPRATIRTVTADDELARERARAHELVDRLLGPSDQAADRAVTVLHAHAAALTWIHAAGIYPTPPSIASELTNVAHRLRTTDHRDPVEVLGQAAITSLAAYRAHNAA